MRFDNQDLPTEEGASSFGDSARLAGIMVMLKDERFEPLNILSYVKYNEDGKVVGVRHPTDPQWNNWKNFTRDQLLPLATGLSLIGSKGTVRKLRKVAVNNGNRCQNSEIDIPGSEKVFPDGPDWLSPSHMNHLRICGGESPTLFGKLCLISDIIFHCKITPEREPNQILVMCISAGKFYVDLYKKLLPTWREGIKIYWCGWRNEKELTDRLIKFIEEFK